MVQGCLKISVALGPFGRNGRRGHHRTGRYRGVKGVGTGHDFQNRSSVFQGVGEGPDLVKGGSVGNESVARNAAVGWLHAHNAGKCSGLANGAAGVRAQGYMAQARGHCGGRAARRSARNFAGVQGVAHRTVVRRFVGRAHGEFVAVGAAQKHGTRGFQALYSRGRKQTFKRLQHFGAGRNPVAAVAKIVFQRHHHSRQRQGITGRQTGIYGRGLGASGFREQFNKHVEVSGLPGACQGFLHQSGTGSLPRGNRAVVHQRRKTHQSFFSSFFAGTSSSFMAFLNSFTPPPRPRINSGIFLPPNNKTTTATINTICHGPTMPRKIAHAFIAVQFRIPKVRSPAGP